MGEVDRLNKDYHGSPCGREQTYLFPRLARAIWDQFKGGCDGHIDCDIDKNMSEKLDGILCQKGVHGKVWYQQVNGADDQNNCTKDNPDRVKKQHARSRDNCGRRDCFTVSVDNEVPTKTTEKTVRGLGNLISDLQIVGQKSNPDQKIAQAKGNGRTGFPSAA